MQRHNLGHQRDQGFTFIEIMIFTVLMTVITLGIVRALQNTSVASVLHSDRARAAQAVERMHSMLRKSDFASLRSEYTIVDNKFTTTAEVSPISSYNVRTATITVTWQFKGHPKKEVTVVTLTEEGQRYEATGKLYAQALDADTGAPISGYLFCAVPYQLESSADLSIRSLTRMGAVTQSNGKAMFEALPIGKWFIFPLGRAGSVLTDYSNFQPYRASISSDLYAYPAVVRRFDYDFADNFSPTGFENIWSRQEAAKAWASQNLDSSFVPDEFPYQANLFVVQEGKLYNDPVPPAGTGWNNPNHDGTLVFKIKRAGSIRGQVREADNQSSSPYLFPHHGIDDVTLKAEFSPLNYLYAGTDQLKEFSVIARLGSSDQPFSLRDVTYLSRNFLGSMFNSHGPHEGVPPFANSLLNSSASPYRQMLAKTANGSNKGHYSIYAAQGALAQPAGYDANSFLDTSLVPVRLSVTSVVDPSYLPGVLLQGDSSSDTNAKLLITSDPTPTLMFDASAGVDETHNITFVPSSMLSRIRAINNTPGQTNVSYQVIYTGFDGDVINYNMTADSSAEGAVNDVETPKNALPSASNNDPRTIKFHPALVTGTLAPVTVAGHILEYKADGTSADLNVSGSYRSLDSGSQVGGPFSVGGAFSTPSFDAPTASSYNDVVQEVVIKPGENNPAPISFSFTGSPTANIQGEFSKPGYVHDYIGGLVYWSGSGNNFQHYEDPIYFYRIYTPGPFTITVVDSVGPVAGITVQVMGRSIIGSVGAPVTAGVSSAGPTPAIGTINGLGGVTFVRKQGANYDVMLRVSDSSSGCYYGLTTVTFDTAGLMQEPPVFSPNSATLLVTPYDCTSTDTTSSTDAMTDSTTDSTTSTTSSTDSTTSTTSSSDSTDGNLSSSDGLP